ncbi:NAD(P)H-binding protein [Georgenia muralis]|uniref:NAD(P)H dehydrogenase (Quinone) n=1 Tax=Georgenia muralis TaxID=154117 RepID=A0A3N4ZAT4_9MICO|nr:NAD(P)H-binding protein [Georgenia muralis]RPF29184.1 NAD(P)H dehydrogenase (quinone) [Georgenia muralis]
MTVFAVTGATGPFGRTAIDQLISRGVEPSDVVAVVRTPERATDLAARGVQVRRGDYDAALDDALAGVDRLLLVSGSEVGRRVPQHRNVVETAGRAGVSRIAYTSVLRAAETPLVIAPDHRATEEILARSGIAHSVLRNTWYTENFTGALAAYTASGAVTHAAGAGRVAAATRADLAEAAAVALMEDDGGDIVRELAGPAFTYAELAAAVSEGTGTSVVERSVSAEELSAALTAAGLDAPTASFLVAVDANIAEGALDGDAAELESLLGRPATTLADAVRAAQG